MNGTLDGAELRQILEDVFTSKIEELSARFLVEVRKEFQSQFQTGDIYKPRETLASDATACTFADLPGSYFREPVEIVEDDTSSFVKDDTSSFVKDDTPVIEEPLYPPRCRASRRWSNPNTDSWKQLVGTTRVDANRGSLDPSLAATVRRIHLQRSFIAEDSDLRARVSQVVLDPRFDCVICGFIVLNALVLGWQTDFMARSGSPTVPSAFMTADSIFCTIFTLEMTLKLFVLGSSYFVMACWRWNVFDLILVIMQLTEELMALFGSSLFKHNLSFARLLKLMRLVRIIRLARILRMIHELRVLVSCIASSIKSLVWVSVLILILIYALSLIFTQLVHEHRISYDSSLCVSDETGCPDYVNLIRGFGDLLRSMLSLFQAITGGMDWDNLAHPLITEIHPLLGVLFCLYVLFAVLALLNVVTGIFVDSVLSSAKREKDDFLLNNAKEIFGYEQDCHINEEQFLGMLDNKHMVEFFRSIDVDSRLASSLFRLMDLDDSGEVNAEEFLSSCIKLRGPARALDTAVLVRDVRSLVSKLRYMDVRPRGATLTESAPPSPSAARCLPGSISSNRLPTGIPRSSGEGQLGNRGSIASEPATISSALSPDDFLVGRLPASIPCSAVASNNDVRGQAAPGAVLLPGMLPPDIPCSEELCQRMNRGHAAPGCKSSGLSSKIAPPCTALPPDMFPPGMPPAGLPRTRKLTTAPASLPPGGLPRLGV